MLGRPTVNIARNQLAHYEQVCAARIHHIIQSKYPGHPFQVTFDFPGFRVVIDHPLLPKGMAITVFLHDEDPDGKIYIRVCGELLERFNLPRAGLDAAGGAFVVDYKQQAEVLSDIK